MPSVGYPWNFVGGGLLTLLETQIPTGLCCLNVMLTVSNHTQFNVETC